MMACWRTPSAPPGRPTKKRRRPPGKPAEAKKLARYDKNKNGVLDEDELAAMKADKEKRQTAAAKRKATAATAQPAATAEPAAEAAADDGQEPDHDQQ